jgi:hypothetical protein
MLKLIKIPNEGFPIEAIPRADGDAIAASITQASL